MSLTGTATTAEVLRGRINKLDTLCLSAYGIAVKNGFDGTEKEWLESLKGPKGDPGAADGDTLLVTVNREGDGSYASDKTCEELTTAKNEGKTLVCWYYDDDVYLPLTLCHGGFTFSVVVDHQFYQITVYSGLNNSTKVSFTKTELEDKSAVKTINGIAPDENGNVDLVIDTGGSGVSRFSLTLEEADFAVTLPLPANWEKIMIINVHIIFPDDKELAQPSVVQLAAGSEYTNIGTFNADIKGYNLYAIRYDDSKPYAPKFAFGTSISYASSADAFPVIGNKKLRATWNSNELKWKFTTDGVVFPMGTKFDAWVVYEA